MVQVVDRVLDHGRVAPVVLRQHEDEPRVFLDFETPGLGVGVAVRGVSGDLGGEGGFVEDGEVPG